MEALPGRKHHRPSCLSDKLFFSENFDLETLEKRPEQQATRTRMDGIRFQESFKQAKVLAFASRARGFWFRDASATLYRTRAKVQDQRRVQIRAETHFHKLSNRRRPRSFQNQLRASQSLRKPQEASGRVDSVQEIQFPRLWKLVRSPGRQSTCALDKRAYLWLRESRWLQMLNQYRNQAKFRQRVCAKGDWLQFLWQQSIQLEYHRLTITNIKQQLESDQNQQTRKHGQRISSNKSKDFESKYPIKKRGSDLSVYELRAKEFPSFQVNWRVLILLVWIDIKGMRRVLRRAKQPD